ncbi:MAG: hypothetical protein JSS89_10980 [Bacteroidetes bacterium]|nr:hypothetical protein [Bacteroidota bacterium]
MMNYALPVKNTFYFLQPKAVEEWQSFDVPGVMGILRKTQDGEYEVIDAFAVAALPSSIEIMSDVRFGYWYAMAGSLDQLRIDAFSMPVSNVSQRENVVTLLSRTCGFASSNDQNYAYAV